MQAEARRGRIPAALFVQVREGQQQQTDVYDHSVGFRTHLVDSRQTSLAKERFVHYVACSKKWRNLVSGIRERGGGGMLLPTEVIVQPNVHRPLISPRHSR